MQESRETTTRKERATPMKMVEWWEKKRYLYNLVLIVFLIFTILSLFSYVGPMLGWPGVIIHGIGFIILGNIFYTSGWAIGILRHYYASGQPLSNGSRWTLFVLGCLLSFLIINFHYVTALDVIFAR